MNRAMCRLSRTPIIKAMVKEFRGKHPDWKSLVSFIVVKNTNRRIQDKELKIDRYNRKKSTLSIGDVIKTYKEKGFDRQTEADYVEQTRRRKKKRRTPGDVPDKDSDIEGYFDENQDDETEEADSVEINDAEDEKYIPAIKGTKKKRKGEMDNTTGNSAISNENKATAMFNIEHEINDSIESRTIDESKLVKYIIF